MATETAAPKTSTRFSIVEKMDEAMKDFKPAPDAPAPTTPNPATPAPDKPKPEPSKLNQPAPATPAAVPADLDEEILTGKRSPKSEDFKRVKNKAKEFEDKFTVADKTAAELKKELEAAKKSPKPDMAEIERLKKDVAEAQQYKTLFNEIALEFNPAFKEKYKTRFDSVFGGLKSALPADKADKIISALQQPEGEFKRKQLAELTDEMDAFQISEIAAANRDIRNIAAERDGELSKAESKMKELHAERQAQTAKQRTEFESAFEAVSARAKDKEKGIPYMQEREGDDEWNKGVNERRAVAKAFFTDQVTAEEKADAAHWAATAPVLLQDNARLAQEVSGLKETITKLQGANPGIDGGGNTPAKVVGGFIAKVNADLKGK